jgi:hypothetical protein
LSYYDEFEGVPTGVAQKGREADAAARRSLADLVVKLAMTPGLEVVSVWESASQLVDLFLHLYCHQESQQSCWNGVGSGSGGVMLDSSAKSSIFSAETTLEATDSDPRL